MSHVSSSTEGYYVMSDTHTGKWDTDRLAGPFPTKAEAEMVSTYSRPDGAFDMGSLLGEYNGICSGYRQTLLDAKQEVRPGSHTWHMLDSLICQIDQRDEVFKAYVNGKFKA